MRTADIPWATNWRTSSIPDTSSAQSVIENRTCHTPEELRKLREALMSWRVLMWRMVRAIQWRGAQLEATCHLGMLRGRPPPPSPRNVATDSKQHDKVLLSQRRARNSRSHLGWLLHPGKVPTCVVLEMGKNCTDQTAGEPEASNPSKTPPANLQICRGVQKRKKKPKRPPTGFNLFAAEVRPIYRREHPHSSTADIERMIGLCWGGMSDKQRRPYIEEADPDCKRGLACLYTPVKNQDCSVDAVTGCLRSTPLPPTPQASASSSRPHNSARARITYELGEKGERFLTELTRDIVSMHTRQQELQLISDDAANNLNLLARPVVTESSLTRHDPTTFDIESISWLESTMNGIETGWIQETGGMDVEDNLLSINDGDGTESIVLSFGNKEFGR
uniref:HMG box domain-containing protein n=1 Tax=Picocystis salinarum TaxID=88271 RepID=A0A7S3XFS0_9CHLO|mmetsp:Transcript_9551/g.58182  ORF Transcript_9551/g.58182 Transcript_9551/m.58182 type:complete len:391 (+) Transcript_9551:507-1679(+)|eukprot:CAMPEP_0183827710 /NCGR_PEP_ID=MMETSP0807_2-20130328/2392_1 /TAXON_ID=88271 /ORGANISM="Picocystis salinarum, Strain CCMP1897" /LENGTH=390 /DNA_ID=CAMNT_0026072881 /DNA_START=479 /DNA_END=1651 /DNA_ORIENTATION=-